MEITEYIDRRLAEAGKRRLLVGICGRAGAGKTTLAEKLGEALVARNLEFVSYSGDWRFLLDSKTRKGWLKEKWRVGLEAYLYALNQFSWWDFDAIYGDLSRLMKGEPVQIEKAYNRATGLKDLDVELPRIDEGVVCYENCILGGVEFLEEIDVVVLVNTPDAICFERILRKDSTRRTVPEIASRLLMTSYSENLFLRTLSERFEHKLLACDSNGRLGGFPEIDEVAHIPVPIITSGFQERRKGTVFCDLDGTLIKHVPVPSETGEEIEIIDGSIEKLQELRDRGYFLVLTTSRPQSKVFAAVERLKEHGLEFDQIISDLPVGPRHLINDSKDGEMRAIAHPLERDSGIGELDLP